MAINGFMFFWLVVGAVIVGLLCIGVLVAVLGILWFIHEARKNSKETKQLHQKNMQEREVREQENQRVRRLLHSVFDDPGQGATV